MTIWLTLQKAAKHLMMGKVAIYKLAHERNIPAHRASRIWRFDAAELDEWMKQGRMVAGSTSENEDGKETKAS